ncbi:MAG TPA: FAD:protein FMN transferase [Candidatus Limnocylindrales bacterium]
MSATLALPARPAVRVPASGAPDVVSAEADLMGGRVGVYLRLAHPPIADSAAPEPRRTLQDEAAQSDAILTIRRIAAWADRLTRFTTTSELSRLNADPAGTVPVGPTLVAVLARAAQAGRESDGIVDPTLLDARLAAERPAGPGEPFADAPAPDRRWAVELRRGGLVTRRPGVRFDLGGIAKGWMADRAAAMLAAYPCVIVDADGDLAIALAHGEEWRIGVADPREGGAELGVLQLAGLDPSRPQRFGLATSGTSVHRWARDGRASHHLIDPRTGRPAVTDVVQATVLAESASAAEIAAKTIVILGSEAGAAMMERPGILAVIVLTERDRVLASPSTLRWLA